MVQVSGLLQDERDFLTPENEIKRIVVMKHQDPRTLRHPLVLIVLHLLFFTGLPGGAPPTFAELPPDLSTGISILSEYKSNADQHAQILVDLDAENDITKNDYRKGQSLYAQAKAGFDGWIDQLVFELQSGPIESLPPNHEAIQEQAKAKGDAFTKYVQELLGKGQRGVVGHTFKSVFASIQEVATSIATGFTQVSPAEQPAVINKLEEYKWPDFHTIEERRQVQRQ
jgi:hypothetical protein